MVMRRSASPGRLRSSRARQLPALAGSPLSSSQFEQDSMPLTGRSRSARSASPRRCESFEHVEAFLAYTRLRDYESVTSYIRSGNPHGDTNNPDSSRPAWLKRITLSRYLTAYIVPILQLYLCDCAFSAHKFAHAKTTSLQECGGHRCKV